MVSKLGSDTSDAAKYDGKGIVVYEVRPRDEVTLTVTKDNNRVTNVLT